MEEKPKYPKDEIRWVGIHDSNDNLVYLITSKPARDRYFLYKLVEGKFVKLGSAPNPKKLEDKFVDWDALRSQAKELPEELEDEELEL